MILRIVLILFIVSYEIKNIRFVEKIGNGIVVKIFFFEKIRCDLLKFYQF